MGWAAIGEAASEVAVPACLQQIKVEDVVKVGG